MSPSARSCVVWPPGSAGGCSAWLTPLPTVPAESCFLGNGTEYRGVASTAASGLSCLAWNSDLLYQELHVDSVGAAALLGLGPHAYCRSALACPARGRRIQGGQGLSWGLQTLLTERLPQRQEPGRGSGPWPQGHCVHGQSKQKAAPGGVEGTPC